jgi:hypothetical protein
MHSPPLYKQSTLRAWRLILLAICKTRRQHQVFTATVKQFYGRNSAARPMCKTFPTCGSARVCVFFLAFLPPLMSTSCSLKYALPLTDSEKEPLSSEIFIFVHAQMRSREGGSIYTPTLYTSLLPFITRTVIYLIYLMTI